MPEATSLIQREEAMGIYKAFQPNKGAPKLQKQQTFGDATSITSKPQ